MVRKSEPGKMLKIKPERAPDQEISLRLRRGEHSFRAHEVRRDRNVPFLRCSEYNEAGRARRKKFQLFRASKFELNEFNVVVNGSLKTFAYFSTRKVARGLNRFSASRTPIYRRFIYPV